MPGEDLQSWSVTAISNGNADSSIDWTEGMPRASVNNSSRSEMAAHAKDRNLNNGSITTGGTANAQTFTSGVGYTSIPTGLKAKLKIGGGLTNTGATTLNMDGIGATVVKNVNGADLSPSDLRAGTYADFLYNGSVWLALGVFSQYAQALSPTVVRVFSAGGTYPTVNNRDVRVLVFCKGGGGGGGGCTITGGIGGGGAEGAEAWKLTTAGALSGQTVTVGSGGVGVAANTDAGGGDGIASGIGSIVSANGGNHGHSCDGFGIPGLGGAPTIGDWGLVGAPGGAGSIAQSANMQGGQGGGKGGAAQAGFGGVAGSGGGGGGGLSTTTASGNGGSGIVVCYEFGAI